MGDFRALSEAYIVEKTREGEYATAAAGESMADVGAWVEAVMANYEEDKVPGQDTYLREHLEMQREGNETRFDAALADFGYSLVSQTFRKHAILPTSKGAVK